MDNKNVIEINGQAKKRKPFHPPNPNGLLTIREASERFFGGGSYAWLRKWASERRCPEAIFVFEKSAKYGKKSKPKILIDPQKFTEYLESHRLSNMLRRKGE
jgi:hypothetical protein